MPVSESHAVETYTRCWRGCAHGLGAARAFPPARLYTAFCTSYAPCAGRGVGSPEARRTTPSQPTVFVLVPAVFTRDRTRTFEQVGQIRLIVLRCAKGADDSIGQGSPASVSFVCSPADFALHRMCVGYILYAQIAFSPLRHSSRWAYKSSICAHPLSSSPAAPSSIPFSYRSRSANHALRTCR